jgi:hypothetical protein
MNQKIIESEIQRKISPNPYFPNPNLIYKIKTDMDTFPYQRFFRGKRTDYYPNIWDREAGYSPINTTITTANPVNESLILAKDACFQMPCSTILPCKADSSCYQCNKKQCVFISP